jgi:hypothetical protein
MLDILAGVPPASFQTHADIDHESLALLFCNTWQRVPSNRLDMFQFLLELRGVEASRHHSNNFPVLDVDLKDTTLEPSPHPVPETPVEGYHSPTMDPTKPLQFGFPAPQSHPLSNGGLSGHAEPSVPPSEYQFGDSLMASTLSTPYCGGHDNLTSGIPIPKIRQSSKSARWRLQGRTSGIVRLPSREEQEAMRYH